MAVLLLLGSLLVYTGFHARHHHEDGQSEHHESSSSCAICLFHGASSTVDFPPVPSMRPELVELLTLAAPAASGCASVIVTLWSGRAPPVICVS
jgi:hypothetical protein